MSAMLASLVGAPEDVCLKGVSSRVLAFPSLGSVSGGDVRIGVGILGHDDSLSLRAQRSNQSLAHVPRTANLVPRAPDRGGQLSSEL
jgi:hypothetical protein